MRYSFNAIIKTSPFMKPVKPQQIAYSKSKCTQGVCSTMHYCYACDQKWWSPKNYKSLP